MVLRLSRFEVVENSLDHAGSEFLRGKAVDSADDFDRFVSVVENGRNIFEKRFAFAARLFCSVENGDSFNRCGDRSHKVFRAERSEKTNFYKADFLSLFEQVVDRLFDRVACAAHSDDDSLSFRIAVVVEKVVASARKLRNCVKSFLNDHRSLIVVCVAGFSCLEEDVGVLSRALENRSFGAESSFFEVSDSIVRNDRFDIFVVKYLDL